MSLERLKKEKTKAKAAFTRSRNRLFMSLEGGLSTRQEIRERMESLAIAMENVITSIEDIELFCESAEESYSGKSLSSELDIITTQFDEAVDLVNVCLAEKNADSPTNIENGNAEKHSQAEQLQILQMEVTKQEQEIEKMVKEIERSIQIRDDASKLDVTDTVAPRNVNTRQDDVKEKDILPSPLKNDQEIETEKNQLNDVLQCSKATKKEELTSTSTHKTTPSKKPQETQTPDQNISIDEKPLLTKPVNEDSDINVPDKKVDEIKLESTKEKTPKTQEARGTSNTLKERSTSQEYQDMFSLPGGYIHASTPISARAATNYTARTSSLEMDSSRLLTRVTIPKFSGDKRNYEAWKAAFMSCVDMTLTTPEYKLLRLRNCLEGEALKVIESLGHSPAAYDIAKERLDRKYGGKRRQMMLRLDELDKFKPIRDGNAKDLEHFAELLDVITVNLRDAGQESELGSGSLYITLQRKLSESLLSKYSRWVFENKLQESVEILREFVNQESEFLTTASETIKGLTKETTKRENASRAFVTSTQQPAQATKRQQECKVCNKTHGVWNCDKFKSLSTSERWNKAKELRLCYRCLDGGHNGKSCTKSRECGVRGCQFVHHRLLHQEPSNSGAGNATPQDASRPVARQQDRGSPQTAATHQTSTSQPQMSAPQPMQGRAHTTTLLTEKSEAKEFVALRTVPVYVINGIKRIKVNALLDDASTKSYLNTDVAAELGLEGKEQDLTVNVLNDNQETLRTSLVEFRLSSIDGKTSVAASAFTTERVTGSMKAVDWNQHKHAWPHLKEIEFPSTGPRPTVDLLIGIDHAELMCAIKEVKGQTGEPIARLTPLGWTCIGQTVSHRDNAHTNYTFFTGSNELNNLVRRFWDVEEPVSSELISPEDKVATKIVEESLTFTDGQYCIGVPWRGDRHSLPDSYPMALRRLQNTEKRLSSSEGCKDYGEVINNYVQRGYIRKVSPDEKKPEQQWFMPHFPVLRPDKATTKTRIVFDASARCQDVSLNDLMFQGPKLQNDLMSVLLRLRREPIALICDIKEMYLQIKLKEEDRPFHRFLWRNLETERSPDIYEFERVVFGVAASPFLAQFVARHHAQEHQKSHPLAADTILNSTYMDDSMDSMPDVATAIEHYNQLSSLWSSAGMYARKWLSNSPDVLSAIPPADCATEIDLDNGELPVTKTLGVTWSPKADEFRFQINQPKERKSTKRGFLKGIATLFDPLGFLTPYIIRGRILLQSIWSEGLDWDDPLDEALEAQVQQWFNELSELSEIHIPRCLKLTSEVQEVTLHTFVDASQEAYGAVTYIRYVYVDGTVSCNLVASKSKVAPLQAVSIPRLELMSAIVGLRLAEKVGPVLAVDKSLWVFWSDSMDTLYWIRRQSRQFKPFVANRVGEIQKSTDPEQWRYVPTKENPADQLTRGLHVAQLKNQQNWWEGPSYLKQDETQWPKCKIEIKERQEHEVRKQFRMDQEGSTFTTMPEDNRLEPKRYSSWKRLTRVLSRVMRFIENCLLPTKQRQIGPLSREELTSSEQVLIKKAQEQVFKDEIKSLKAGKRIAVSSKILPLNPFIDQDGILRSNGRLSYADCLSWESRFPIILPKDHHITKLIIKDCHERLYHGGTNQVLSELSTRYWILSAREAIREWERECMECRRRKTKPVKPIMAPLPAIRTQMSLRAFCQTSVDYAGPFITKQGRGKVRLKRYLCLFTCLSTRAVHLEIAFSLNTDSFLNAFFRMASRRGLPEEVLSDNGTNFVGAYNELEALKALDKEKIQDATSSYGVKWHFNPPLAPHFSGVHEIMVKAAKKAIYAILGSAEVTDEELISAVVGAEGLINSRPLTYQSANPQDIAPLTPNHFLHGQLGGRFAPESVDTTLFNPQKRWRRVQELVRHFWHRWLKEWLPSLNSRKKWLNNRANLKEGDVVIVMSTDTPRGKWPLARIVKTYPGADGNVRVADVQVGSTIMKRPVVKLCPLEYQ